MKGKDINIYGAGLSGLVAAINLVRNRYNVTVFEKENRIGGSSKCHPSIHMTPINIKDMQKYIEIKIDTCFSRLDRFRGYVGPKKYIFSTRNLFVVERGPRETSIDRFLYNIALKEGVNFEFSKSLKEENLKEIPENSIIATAGYSKIVKGLHVPYIIYNQFDTHKNIDIGNIAIAFFGSYSSDYGYISGKNGMISAQLSGSPSVSEENLKIFIEKVKETEGINLDNWSSFSSYFPKKIQLFTKYSRKTFVLAGDIAGFLDPFFGFGINGALISGKIVALSFISKKKALNEFNKFKTNLNKALLFHTLYLHLPFKNLIRSQVLKYEDKKIFPIGRSIPGFEHKDWLKIV